MTRGMITGSKTKVLGTNDYLYTMIIYDDKGRVIQTKSTNTTGGTDVITTQYGWQGLPLVTVQKQQKSGSNAQVVTTVTKNSYDDLGRIIKTEKKQAHSQYNSGAMSAYATISETDDKGSSYLLFNRNPSESGETPASLFLPMEHKYNYKGNSKNATKGSVVKFNETKNTKEEDERWE